MFELPRYVFKAGELIVELGEIRNVPFGPTICFESEFDPGIESHVKPWFEENYSMRFANYPVTDDYLTHGVYR